MKKKHFGIWWLCGIAVVLIGILLVINLSGQGNKAESYPDLEKVDAGAVPDGFDEENQPYLGNPEAPVKIVEFSDYKCPACKQWKDQVLTELKREYLDAGKAAFYYVDMPFLAPDSTLAALAGETLYQQNHDFFWPYFDLMMEQQGKKDDAWANKGFIMKLVKDNIPDVDLKRFERELDEEIYIANVKRDFLIAENHKVDGTPTVFVNGQNVEDISFEGIKAAIDNL
ncbi:protein-disulfide isomerase [Fontibacillus phaseoli]|uniref:Protein-disulfide isomerase n=1 Tax=Fontibacillus phaseoli TaxID=1416533 RepID=A0A369BLB6_9BACL|nr:thioredoxin domain-containing protein [Fontibacillus phaseoli]RCX21386.1 protein-disulfide isomerase [Fontibacillus phaseoli]